MHKSRSSSAQLEGAALARPMKRQDVTDLIAFRKLKLGSKWPEIAKRVGASKERTAAACLGQMQMTKKQAEAVGKLFALPEDAVLLLQSAPFLSNAGCQWGALSQRGAGCAPRIRRPGSAPVCRPAR